MKGVMCSTLVASVLVAFLLTSTFSFAGQQMNQQPEFLLDTGAVSLTVGEMQEVRGEFLPLVYYWAVVFGVPYSIALAAVIARSSVPIYQAMLDAFGS